MSANNLTFYVDDSLQLYIEGIMTYEGVPANEATTPQTLLPDSVTTIAIQATNDANYGGIIASDTDGRVVTSCAWRCTATLTSDGDWYSPSYDDSLWPVATEIAANEGSQQGFPSTVSGIRTEAKWIWTSGYTLPDGNAVVYCRYRVSTMDSTDPPCSSSTAAPLTTSTSKYPQHCCEQPPYHP